MQLKETSRSDGLGTYRVQDSSPLEIRFSAPLKNKTDINHIEWNDTVNRMIKDEKTLSDILVEIDRVLQSEDQYIEI